MNEKEGECYAIGWNSVHKGEKRMVWYKGFKFGSRDDAYGAPPSKTIRRTAFIEDAYLFDTFEDALEIYEDEIMKGGCAFIHFFTAKALFKLKLQGG